jgi:hypothetical protein
VEAGQPAHLHQGPRVVPRSGRRQVETQTATGKAELFHAFPTFLT